MPQTTFDLKIPGLLLNSDLLQALPVQGDSKKQCLIRVLLVVLVACPFLSGSFGPVVFMHLNKLHDDVVAPTPCQCTLQLPLAAKSHLTSQAT